MEEKVIALKEIAEKLGVSYRPKIRHVRYWREQFSGAAISSLTTERIFDALPTHQILKNKGKQKLSLATRNRYPSLCS